MIIIHIGNSLQPFQDLIDILKGKSDALVRSRHSGSRLSPGQGHRSPGILEVFEGTGFRRLSRTTIRDRRRNDTNGLFTRPSSWHFCSSSIHPRPGCHSSFSFGPLANNFGSFQMEDVFLEVLFRYSVVFFSISLPSKSSVGTIS